MSLLDDFLIRAAVAGLGVVLATAPLGCLVVWRRMAFFGDATAHAAVLGVAVSLAFSISIFIGTLGAALAMGLLVSSLSGRTFAMDTALGVLAHAALAAGLVGVSLTGQVRIDISSYLFGDILSVSRGDIALIWGGGCGCSGAIDLALAGAFDRHTKPRSGPCGRARSAPRGHDPDIGIGFSSCCRDQSGRRALDWGVADHSTRHRAQRGTHP